MIVPFDAPFNYRSTMLLCIFCLALGFTFGRFLPWI